MDSKKASISKKEYIFFINEERLTLTEFSKSSIARQRKWLSQFGILLSGRSSQLMMISSLLISRKTTRG